MQPLLPFAHQRHIFSHSFLYVFVHVKEPFSNLALEMKPQVHSE